MKKLLTLALLVAVIGYGYIVYSESRLPYAEYLPGFLFSGAGTKCITRNGEVFYGVIPYGTDCARIELVKGAVSEIGGDTSTTVVPTAPSQFRCDGRTHCSEMRSCAEAQFFLENCPNTRMDGDGDGISCERQWCG